MTPEAAEHLDKARDYLAKGPAPIDVLHYADEAGRAAYLAGVHAAQGFILERTESWPRRTQECTANSIGWQEMLPVSIWSCGAFSRGDTT